MSEKQLRTHRVTMRNQATSEVIETWDMTADEYDRWLDARKASDERRLNWYAERDAKGGVRNGAETSK
jgi:hypothetical protein